MIRVYYKESSCGEKLDLIKNFKSYNDLGKWLCEEYRTIIKIDEITWR